MSIQSIRHTQETFHAREDREAQAPAGKMDNERDGDEESGKLRCMQICAQGYMRLKYPAFAVVISGYVLVRARHRYAMVKFGRGWISPHYSRAEVAADARRSVPPRRDHFS
jgi:hypothetical protein